MLGAAGRSVSTHSQRVLIIKGDTPIVKLRARAGQRLWLGGAGARRRVSESRIHVAYPTSIPDTRRLILRASR